jgi:hypothetical protein
MTNPGYVLNMTDDHSTEGKPYEGAGTGFPEPPGKDPGDISKDEEPHHSLSNPARDPDPTEWPDPYDKRPDPKGPEERGEDSSPGDRSTSEPHPSHDLEAGEKAEAPEGEHLDG